MMRLPTYAARLALLCTGFTLGLLGITIYEHTPLASKTSASGPLASACMNTISMNDDIFFLSCGGIY